MGETPYHSTHERRAGGGQSDGGAGCQGAKLFWSSPCLTHWLLIATVVALALGTFLSQLAMRRERALLLAELDLEKTVSKILQNELDAERVIGQRQLIDLQGRNSQFKQDRKSANIDQTAVEIDRLITWHLEPTSSGFSGAFGTVIVDPMSGAGSLIVSHLPRSSTSRHQLWMTAASDQTPRMVCAVPIDPATGDGRLRFDAHPVPDSASRFSIRLPRSPSSPDMEAEIILTSRPSQ